MTSSQESATVDEQRSPLLKTVVVVGALPDSLIRFRGPLIAAIARAGHRVIGCAAIDDILAKDTDPAASLAKIGAEFRHIPFDRTGFNLRNDLKALRALKDLFTEIRPDVVVSYTIKPNLYASLAAKFGRVPKVCALISGIGYGLEGAARKRPVGRAIVALHRYAFQGVHTGIFQNPDDRELFRRLGILKNVATTAIVNGSGVDTDHYSPTPFPPGEISFLLIARLMKDKGVFEFVAAAKLLRDEGISAKFRMAGGLDKRPGSLTQNQLDRLVQEGIVEYLGELSDVRPAIADCHVYVLPSFHEGTPRTVLEAMAMGRPIITTDARGCKETTIDGVNGFLVPIGGVSPLAEDMRRYIDSPDLIPKHGAASREIALKKYDVNLVNAEMMRAMGL